MKITYECEFCGFHSQDKDEVQKCESQGVKNKFSVGEGVEWLNEFNKEKKQWVRATIVAVHFEERTHKIRYSIKPEPEIPVTAHKHGPNLAFAGGSVNEEELRPLKQEQIHNQKFLPPQECEFPDDVPKIGQVVQIQLPATERLNPMVLETTVRARNVGTRCWVIHVYEPISKEMISFTRDLAGEWHEEVQRGRRKAKILS